VDFYKADLKKKKRRMFL